MKKNIILIIVAFALFMESVDTTIINTAIPAMAASLKVGPVNLKLALISYLMSLAIFIPVSGWIADKFGMKKVFILAVTVFTLSSIACGFTQTLPQLVFARILQGLGGSLTLPVGRLIILRTCERHELISKMSIVVMIAALGMMLGPLLGGIITQHFSWSWIFWVNVPIGALTIALALYLLPAMPARKVPPLDKFGFILFGAGLATLTLGLSTLSENDVPHTLPLFLILTAALLLFLYIKHSHKKPHPIVKVDLLRVRTFRIAVLGNLFARLGFGGVPFLMPLLLQIGLGFSPGLSGMLLAPVALGVFMVKPLSLYILRFFGYKKLLIINTFFVALVLLSLATIKAGTSVHTIGFFTFLYGFLIALQYTAMNSLAYANLANDDMGAATSIMSTIQQLAQSFGVAVAALMLQLFSTHSLLSIKIFHQTFITIAIMTFLSLLIFMQLQKEDGRELIDIPPNLE